MTMRKRVIEQTTGNKACRVSDIRVLAGIHADRDAATNIPLLFKPETIPDGTALIH